MAYFIWNGIDSRSKNIGLKTLPPRTKPAERIELISVPGRSGFLTQKENAFDSMTLSVECWLKKDSNVYDVINWLQGAGTLIFSDDLTKQYEAVIVNAIPFDKVLKFWKSFVIQFEVQPFNKGVSKQSVTITSPTLNTTKTVNGNVETEPIITLNGTGNFNITVNAKTFILTNVSGAIVVDSSLFNCTEANGTVNANGKLSGDFPVLVPGNNTISIQVVNGSFTTLLIEYYEKYL